LISTNHLGLYVLQLLLHCSYSVYSRPTPDREWRWYSTHGSMSSLKLLSACLPTMTTASCIHSSIRQPAASHYHVHTHKHQHYY